MEMRLPRFLKSVRYCLAIVNGAFLVTGILLLTVGVVVSITYSEYDQLITKRFFTLTNFVIATAVIILLTSILGFYAAISEHFYFIAGYVVLLLVVLVFEVSIVIVSFGLHNDTTSEIRSTMLQHMREYETKIEVAKIWDELQQAFECCGVAGVHDWVPSNRIPVSCCHIDYGTVSPFECNAGDTYIYSTGCASALGDWLSYNAHVIAVTSLVVTCLQVLITSAAGWLAWRSKFEEVELES